MISPDWKNCTEEEFWRYIAYHLTQNNIDSILVGGAVVAIYSKSIYRSGDIDLILYEPIKEVEPILIKLGFHKEGRHFIHPECKHIFLEFVNPPLAIGKDYQIQPREILVESKVLKLLSPTDCIKDRLASYMYYQARECFEQAILVAKNQLFDSESIKLWCDNEQHPAIYDEFMAEMKIFYKGAGL